MPQQYCATRNLYKYRITVHLNAVSLSKLVL